MSQDQSPGSRSEKPRFGTLRRVGVVLALVVLSLEVGLRAFGLAAPHPGGYWRGLYAADEELHFLLQPGFEGKMVRADTDVPVIINASGFRDNPFGPKREGTLRILALGDSFTFGHAVSAAESFPSVIEERLSAEGQPIEVHNLGIPGYNTAEEVALLRRVGPGMQPDLVVVGFYVGNDIRDHLESRVGRTTARCGYIVTQKPGQSMWTVTLKAWLVTYSQIWRTAQNAMRRLDVRSSTKDELREAYCTHMEWSAHFSTAVMRHPGNAEVEEAYARTFVALADMQRACEELGTPLMIALFPAPLQYEPFHWEIVHTQCRLDPGEFDLERPQREIMTEAARLGIPTLDVTPTLRAWCAATTFDPEHPFETRPYLDVHFSPVGHAIVADEIIAFLREQKLLP